MLTQFIRVFKGAAGSPIALTDMSMDNAEKTSYALNTEYLYIAQKFPFNNIFMQLGTVVNAAASVMKIEYWSVDGWKEAVDVLDFTKGLKRNGLIQFSLNNDNSWDKISESDADEDNGVPDEVKGKSINDCYWVRISFTGVAVDAATEIKSISYAFTTTEKVNAVDTQMSRHYTTFNSTKTNWLDEILIGSEMMIADMKTAGMLKSHGEIILLDDFYLPCAWRVLMHIYSQLGTAYDGKRGEVSALYKNFMKGPMTLDKDLNARIDDVEQTASHNRMTR